MAENPTLAQVLAGISALKTKGELDAVRDAVKNHREELKKNRSVVRFLTEEGKYALAKGNSKEMIAANEKVYDYSRVAKKNLKMAKKWFKAPKPYTGRGDDIINSAYYQWRLWNADNWDRYKGGDILDKATGESAYSPPTEEAGPMWHRKDEGEESEEEESEGEESEGEESEGEDVGAAMAAVKLE